jgi:hypothetical protein
MLIYRDIRSPRPTAFRVPPWLENCANLVRQTVEGQDQFWCGDPAVRPTVPAKAWHPLPDDFEVANIGPLDPMTLLRNRNDLMVTGDTVTDGQGRRWRGLVVFDADNTCHLTLKWGRAPGATTLSRIPEDWQLPLLAGAAAARAEIEANRLDQVPIDAAMSWLIPLLCEIYHLHPEVIIQERLIDDRLATALMRISAGYAA